MQRRHQFLRVDVDAGEHHIGVLQPLAAAAFRLLPFQRNIPALRLQFDLLHRHMPVLEQHIVPQRGHQPLFALFQLPDSFVQRIDLLCHGFHRPGLLFPGVKIADGFQP